MYEIFNKYAPLTNISQPYRNFYDIGSGIGKLVIGMAYKSPILKLTGIEIVPERVQNANTALEKVRDEQIKRRIEFVCISMLDDSVKYTNACWIFLSNLCMTDEESNNIFIKLANETKKGCIIVCLKENYYDCYQKLNHISLPMSWSNETKVFVYSRI